MGIKRPPRWGHNNRSHLASNSFCDFRGSCFSSAMGGAPCEENSTVEEEALWAASVWHHGSSIEILMEEQRIDDARINQNGITLCGEPQFLVP